MKINLDVGMQYIINLCYVLIMIVSRHQSISNPCLQPNTSSDYQQLTNIPTELDFAVDDLLQNCRFGTDIFVLHSDLCFTHCSLREDCEAIYAFGTSCKFCERTGYTQGSLSDRTPDNIFIRTSKLGKF